MTELTDEGVNGAVPVSVPPDPEAPPVARGMDGAVALLTMQQLPHNFLNEEFTFPFFLAAMRRPDLADDPRFRTTALRRKNLDELHALVQTWIWTFDSMESLDAQFDESKLATGRLRTVNEFNETAWARAWKTTRTVPDRSGGSITVPGRPWHFRGSEEPEGNQSPARQGEHNVEILSELGYDDGEIQALRQSSALIGPA